MWLINAVKTCWHIISKWFVLLSELIASHWVFVGIFSGISLILSIVGCAALITYLPADYFTVTKQGQHIKNPILRILVALVKNLVGVILIILGILLSVPGVPGQGLLTVLTGLVISDFPGKKRLARRIIGMQTVYSAANKIRGRFKRPPLVLEDIEQLVSHDNKE